MLFLTVVKRNLGEWRCACNEKKIGAERTVREKHAEDVWMLMDVIQKCKQVPRKLLKNGKHD